MPWTKASRAASTMCCPSRRRPGWRPPAPSPPTPSRRRARAPARVPPRCRRARAVVQRRQDAADDARRRARRRARGSCRSRPSRRRPSRVGSEPMIDSVAGAMARPMPPPSSTMAHEDPAVARRRSSCRRPRACRPTNDAQPDGDDALGAEPLDELDDSGAVTITATANGSVRTPASSGRVAEDELQVLRRP